MLLILLNITSLSFLIVIALITAVYPYSNSNSSAAPPSTINQSTSKTAVSLQSLEQSVHVQINQYRSARGLPPLSIDSRVAAQAIAHSNDMAKGRVPFGHDGFQQRVGAIERSSISYTRAAENVAYNMGYRDPAKQAVQGWIASPGHRRNIEGSYDTTGIGVAQNAKGEYYFTQIFIRRR